MLCKIWQPMCVPLQQVLVLWDLIHHMVSLCMWYLSKLFNFGIEGLMTLLVYHLIFIRHDGTKQSFLASIWLMWPCPIGPLSWITSKTWGAWHPMFLTNNWCKCRHLPIPYRQTNTGPYQACNDQSLNRQNYMAYLPSNSSLSVKGNKKAHFSGFGLLWHKEGHLHVFCASNSYETHWKMSLHTNVTPAWAVLVVKYLTADDCTAVPIISATCNVYHNSDTL